MKGKIFLLGWMFLVCSVRYAQAGEQGPDLIWYDFKGLTSPGNDWVAGGNATVEITIRNQGTEDVTTPFWVQLYLSRDAVYDVADDLLTSVTCPILAGLEERTLSLSFPVPEKGDGSYYLFALADAAKQVEERNENNNLWIYPRGITLRHGLPDLVGLGIEVSSTLWIPPWASVAVSLTVRNQGTETAGAHESRFYLSTDSRIDENDMPLGEGPLGFYTINANGNATRTQRILVPDLPNGTYYLGALIDVNQAVVESDETNNASTPTRIITLQRGDYTDLLPLRLALSKTAWVPGVTSVTATVVEKNQGTVPAGAHRTGVYLSSDPTITRSDRVLGELTFPILGSSATFEHTLVFTVPSDLKPGTYYVGVITDIYDQVVESDENNNIGTQVIPVAVGIQTASIRALVSQTLAAGGTCTVQIQVGIPTPVTNLFALSFKLNHTAGSYLQLVSARGGPFFGRDTLMFVNQESTTGAVAMSLSKKGEVPGLSGSGIAAQIVFQISPLAPNNLAVHFSLTQILGIDPTGQAIVLTEVEPAVGRIQNLITVWPGDTNNDGVVNQADVIPIGFHWGNTGPMRPGASLSWTGQGVEPWTIRMSTYADANGDGVVDQADVMAIGVNWNKRRPAKASKPPLVDAMFRILPMADEEGTSVRLGVWVEGFPSALLGLAFGLTNEGAWEVTQIRHTKAWDENPLVFSRQSGTEMGWAVTKRACATVSDLSEPLFVITMRRPTQKGEARLRFNEIILADGEGKLWGIEETEWAMPGEALVRMIAPKAFTLGQNYPNPFNPATRIVYTLPEDGQVLLEVFDCLGRVVQTLVQEVQEAGRYEILFDASSLPSGLYYYRIRFAGQTITKKMILLR